MSIKEKNNTLKNEWQLDKKISFAKKYYRHLQIEDKQIEITPKDINGTKNTKLTSITCLSNSPGFSIKSSLSKYGKKSISFFNRMINQNHHCNSTSNKKLCYSFKKALDRILIDFFYRKF